MDGRELSEGLINFTNLENEKRDLLSSNQEFSNKVDMALCKIKNLEDFINVLAAKLIELDNQSLSFSEKVVQLNALYDSCFKMGQEERHIAAQSAQHKFDQLHDQTLRITSEKDAAQLVNQELNNKVIELQKQQEFAMVQHAEECRLAEERIRRLESEAETLLSKRTDMEILIPKLQEKIDTSIESSRLSEEKMQELLLKLSALENENKDNTENLQAEIQKKNEEIVVLQKEIRMHEQHVEALEKQVSQLGSTLEEKEQLVLQFKDKEKQLKDQKTEVQALLVDAESKLTEAKKQYDQMLESKQLELSRHLKEISQKNDQAINDIRRKYEVEKLESVNLEKEKADKVIGEMERKYDQKLAECKEESKQYLVRVQEEHAALLSCLQQENDKKESILIFDHSEELKRVQLQAENELREEDRQRALLQLQWKVMSDNAQEDQEVNSKKNYSISSTKMRSSDGGKRGQHALVRAEDEEKESPFLRATQTPVSNLLKKVEKVNSGSVMTIPKHSRKVTRHEYEVETANGRTITKRRKTKSTVMFGDPRKHKKGETPKAKTPRNDIKGIKGGRHPNPSNIGDLFSEGSLNPYADDPYAFD
ncbi:unnamed protein product [Ilex paraguariensis]|uniref:Synaptonemal complex protein 1 n=2 Tax=Ilex paraguariensis TaxID=185542 RepID=A0ABC8SEL2_9AQUA